MAIRTREGGAVRKEGIDVWQRKEAQVLSEGSIGERSDTGSVEPTRGRTLGGGIDYLRRGVSEVMGVWRCILIGPRRALTGCDLV